MHIMCHCYAACNITGSVVVLIDWRTIQAAVFRQRWSRILIGYIHVDIFFLTRFRVNKPSLDLRGCELTVSF